MKVEIVYANKTQQFHQELELVENATIQQAIEASNLLQVFQEINLAKADVGVFGKKLTLSSSLNAGDRIEVYRPLTIDPMQKRRRLAEIQRKNKP